MYLTHIDEQGNDSPAILIDNSTAANRAVNLPEFVNIPQDGLVAINTPAVVMYREFDHAAELGEKGEYEAAIAEWRELAATNPDDTRIHNNLGTALTQTSRYAEAIPEFEKALELDAQYSQIYNNLGHTLLAVGRADEAISTLEKGLEYYPESADLHDDLGLALVGKNRLGEAKAEFDKALEIDPNLAEAHHNLGRALAAAGHRRSVQCAQPAGLRRSSAVSGGPVVRPLALDAEPDAGQRHTIERPYSGVPDVRAAIVAACLAHAFLTAYTPALMCRMCRANELARGHPRRLFAHFA